LDNESNFDPVISIDRKVSYLKDHISNETMTGWFYSPIKLCARRFGNT